MYTHTHLCVHMYVVCRHTHTATWRYVYVCIHVPLCFIPYSIPIVPISFNTTCTRKSNVWRPTMYITYGYLNAVYAHEIRNLCVMHACIIGDLKAMRKHLSVLCCRYKWIVCLVNWYCSIHFCYIWISVKPMLMEKSNSLFLNNLTVKLMLSITSLREVGRVRMREVGD